MAIKVKISGIRLFNQSLKRVFRPPERTVLNKLGDAIIRLIQKRTRAGRSSTNRTLRKLKPSTIRSRKSFARNNQTGKGFVASKSNLTLTGQLLESLVKRVNVSKQTVTVLPRGRRGKKPNKNLSFQKQAGFQEDAGRKL